MTPSKLPERYARILIVLAALPPGSDGLTTREIFDRILDQFDNKPKDDGYIKDVNIVSQCLYAMRNQTSNGQPLVKSVDVPGGKKHTITQAGRDRLKAESIDVLPDRQNELLDVPEFLNKTRESDEALTGDQTQSIGESILNMDIIKQEFENLETLVDNLKAMVKIVIDKPEAKPIENRDKKIKLIQSMIDWPAISQDVADLFEDIRKDYENPRP